MLSPPRNVTPGRLFRLLLGRPRPRLRLAYQIPGLEHLPLFVRGLTSVEFADAQDVNADAVVSAFLVLEDWRLAFPSPASIGLLRAHEAEKISKAALDAASVVSPLYGRSDVKVWEAMLVRGAEENRQAAFVLGNCKDVALGAGRRMLTPRPERYWGGSVADLTDGQWMAFWAAQKVLEEMIPKPQTRPRR